MKRKKQGSSLIVVVIVSMFIFTVSTAMLSMVAGNYKARVVESKRVENLYASDSGLDVTYNIIGKTFDAATKYAKLKVEKMQTLTDSSIDDRTSIYNEDYIDIKNDIKLLQDDIIDVSAWNTNNPDEQKTQSELDREIAQIRALITDDENIEDTLCNEEFKRAFRNFIKEHEYEENDPKYDEDEDEEQDRLGAQEQVPNKLEILIENHQYVSGITDTDSYTYATIDFDIENNNNESPTLDASVTESEVGNSYESTGISTSDDHHKDVSFTIYEDQYYDIAVTSTFYTDSYTVSGEEKTVNERQLKATYKIIVPNYKDIYSENSNEGLNDLATKDRALTIYGDMNVNNVSGLTVDGEIFVQGSNDTSSSDRVYGKYYGGIKVKNSDKVNFNGNVITRGTFNIQTPTTEEDTNTRTTSIDKSLYAKNIYVGNIDSTELPNQPSQLIISNGVINNDLTLNANNAKISINNLYGINDINFDNKVESSSSIIVNADKNSNSTIDILDSVYLMGTAHIATTDKYDYQTAESGAVKGNYKAYSVPLDTSDEFEYHDPLQLLVGDFEEKKQHFLDYWNQEEKNADAGGIQWPDNGKIYSIGVIVYETTDDTGVNKSEVIEGNSTADAESNGGEVNSKRVEFAQYDYKFGQDASLSDYTDSNIISFDSLIDISKIPTKSVLTDGEYAIFNGGSSKIEITENTTTYTEIAEDSDNNIINIKVGSNSDLNAIIATAGNVTIESGVTINGCIIAKGYLEINGDDVNINYDSDVIDRVQAQNFDDFKTIFGESLDDTDTTDDSTSTDTNYDLENFFEKKSWKILK
jgi:hypothetical protein